MRHFQVLGGGRGHHGGGSDRSDRQLSRRPRPEGLAVVKDLRPPPHQVKHSNQYMYGCQASPLGLMLQNFLRQ